MTKILFNMLILCMGGFMFTACTILPIGKGSNPLEGKVICIDPGHGGSAEIDHYRVGPTGEREEWVNLRVALMLRDMLKERGAHVLMTRVEDVQVGLKERALLAVENEAQVFISLHHNATADPEVNFPIIYFHGNASENRASVKLGECVARHLAAALFDNDTPVSLVSDHTIFPNSGTAVLRHSYGIPGVIGEASFFSNPQEEQRLKNEDYNRREAEAYCKALEEFFSTRRPGIKEKYSTGKVPDFEVFQEADRMKEEALKWYQEYEEGLRLMRKGDAESLDEAYELFTRSARSFPDSWVARECHVNRARILRQTSKTREAEQEMRRVEQYYPPR